MKTNWGCLAPIIVLTFLAGWFLVRVGGGEQREVWNEVAMSFSEQRCRTGRLAGDVDEFMRASTPEERVRAEKHWRMFDVRARVVPTSGAPILRVSGSCFWRFTREETLDGIFEDCGQM